MLHIVTIVTGILLTDLSNAYGCTNHEFLITYTHVDGFRIDSLNFIRKYLICLVLNIYQTSITKKKIFAKLVNVLNLLTIFAKSSILDISLGFEYTFMFRE